MARRFRWDLAALAAATAAVIALWSVALQNPGRADTAGTALPTPTTTTEPPVVAVIGDSYTGGSDEGGYGAANWTQRVAAALADEGTPVTLSVAVEGGAGYVAEGVEGGTFGELVPEAVAPTAEVVIVFGSRNDSGDISDAAAATLAAVRAAAPTATLLVIGPPWVDDDPTANVVASRDALAAAAADLGATFVDPLAEGWFADGALIGEDGVHPTDEGHAYMAELILPHLRAALT